MLGALDAQELLEWQAVYLLDPWGGERGDINAATIALMWAGKDTELDDLMPDFGKAWREAIEKEEEERARERMRKQKADLMVFTSQMGGKIIREGAGGDGKRGEQSVDKSPRRPGRRR